MLIVPDTPGAIAWYERALGARVRWDLGGVAGLEIGGAPFFLHEAGHRPRREAAPLEVGRTSTRIEVFVADPDAFVSQAVACGATLLDPVEAHARSWGTHRQGQFADPFGHHWSVGDPGPLHPNAG